MPTTQIKRNLTQNFIRAFTQRGGPGPQPMCIASPGWMSSI
jgi:hypothetical protein